MARKGYNRVTSQEPYHMYVPYLMNEPLRDGRGRIRVYNSEDRVWNALRGSGYDTIVEYYPIVRCYDCINRDGCPRKMDIEWCSLGDRGAAKRE